MISQKGMTLLELMIALAIAAIVAAMAAPSFQNFLKKNSVESETRTLLADLGLARSTAVSQNSVVSICPINSATTGCSSSWSNGWLVFIDDGEGTSGVAGNLIRDGDEKILKVQQHLGSLNIASENSAGTGVDAIQFSVRGYMDAILKSGSTGAQEPEKVLLKVCEKDNDVAFARAILMDLTGRGIASVDKNGDGVHDNLSGADLTCP